MTEDEKLYENDVERQWSEESSVRGISPELMSSGQRPASPPPPRTPATFSIWLIPFASVLTGPLIASLLTLLVDGDPPKARHAITVLCTGIIAWVVNVGVAVAETPFLTPRDEGMLRLGVLVVTGGVLWAMYVFWIKGRQAINQQALINSAIIFFALSMAFWIGRDTSWWIWLGR